MSPANHDKHAELLRRAEKLRELAGYYRKMSGYADSAQARESDEKQARACSEQAHQLESEAAELMRKDP